MTAIEESKDLQVLVLLPNRELIMQVNDVITKIAQFIPHIKIVMLRQEDKTTTDFGNILISQVSKISTLVKLKKLKTDTLKMVVVDEADYFFESPED